MASFPVSSESTRRSRFREYIRNVNPTADPQEALSAGMVVDQLRGTLHQGLAARADLQPGSQQLLVGGIGSGKTTELLLAERWLRTEGESEPFFIDVSKETNLARLEPGALLASFGLRLISFIRRRGHEDVEVGALIPTLESTFQRVKEFAHGRTVWQSRREREQDEQLKWMRLDKVPVFLPGKLKNANGPVLPDIGSAADPVLELLKRCRDLGHETVVLFDGLDRLTNPELFEQTVHQDFSVFRHLNVSVVTTGPISAAFGKVRSLLERFDRVQHVPVLRVDPAVLRQVLDLRGASALLADEALRIVCEGSGGLLRDLISLARDAGEEAYVARADKVEAEHAEKALKHLGNSYRRGLSQSEIDVLKHIMNGESFDPGSAEFMRLLVARVVLEYSAVELRVHPALARLLSHEDQT